MDIYVKPPKRFFTSNNNVSLGEVVDIIATTDVVNKLKNQKLATVSQNTKHIVSITDIVKLIREYYPNYSVVNLGEMDTIIEFLKPENKLLSVLKMLCVCVVLFMGASTAIMSFHTDAQVPEIFRNYYKMFYGKEEENPKLIAVPYSIGLAFGIILFFNHIGGNKITNDPTPIEVEIDSYNNEVYNTLVEKK